MQPEKTTSDKPSVAKATERVNEPPLWIVIYVALVLIITCFFFYFLFISTPYITNTMNTDFNVLDLFMKTAGMMLCAGTLGGSLYDLRGLMKHTKQMKLAQLIRLFFQKKLFKQMMKNKSLIFLMMQKVRV